MSQQSLADAVTAHPLPEYANWWPIKEVFVGCVARAVSDTWQQLPGNSGDLSPVRAYATEYMALVYQRRLAPGRVEAFAAGAADLLASGEFDALSYGFYRSAFEMAEDRLGFTQAVGKHFFSSVASALDLMLPTGLTSESEFAQLQTALQRLGRFLLEQGYLRTHFAFRFDVARGPDDEEIHQTADQVVARLARARLAYALYEMGYPASLPAATYLFYTLGEAQHYSSRMVQALFDRIGYAARATGYFRPTDFGANLVVEMWEIRPQG